MRILLADHAPTAKPGDVFLYNDPYGSGYQIIQSRIAGKYHCHSSWPLSHITWAM